MLIIYFKLIQVIESLINLILVLVYIVIRFVNGQHIVKNNRFNQLINILGNGPSLKQDEPKIIEQTSKSGNFVMVVNMFATTELFEKIKPNFYIIADMAFFQKTKSGRIEFQKEKLFSDLEKKTSWSMDLMIPRSAKNSNVLNKLKNNKLIRFSYYNNYPIMGGFQNLNNLFFKFNLANPLYQNVLIAAIFSSMKLGFKNIYLWGADHSWHEGFKINNDNQISTLDLHFYDEKQTNGFVHCKHDGTQINVFEEFSMLSRTFQVYHCIEKYAKTVGVKIINRSYISWIDAFEKK